MTEFLSLVCIVAVTNCRFVVLIVISNWFLKTSKASPANGYWEWSNSSTKLSLRHDLYHGGIIVSCSSNYQHGKHIKTVKKICALGLRDKIKNLYESSCNHIFNRCVQLMRFWLCCLTEATVVFQIMLVTLQGIFSYHFHMTLLQQKREFQWNLAGYEPSVCGASSYNWRDVWEKTLSDIW